MNGICIQISVYSVEKSGLRVLRKQFNALENVRLTVEKRIGIIRLLFGIYLFPWCMQPNYLLSRSFSFIFSTRMSSWAYVKSFQINWQRKKNRTNDFQTKECDGWMSELFLSYRNSNIQFSTWMENSFRTNQFDFDRQRSR